MDFKSVLNIAKANSNGFGSKGYPNAASGSKKGGEPDVKGYLEKKKREEEHRAIEAEKRRRELIELRAQAKNSKKARAMTRRTKDNNFMAYLEVTSDRLATVTEEIKHKDILKRTLGNDKSAPALSKCPPKTVNNGASREHASPRSSDRKPPPASSFNYNELLNIASNKQHLPTDLPRIPKKKVVDVDIQGRLMTNEEKRKFIEEEARKQGRPLASVNVPKKTTRGPRYRGEENNVVTESLIEKVPPPLAKKDGRKPATQLKPSLPTQKPIPNQPNMIISQQKVVQQSANRPRPSNSAILTKNVKYGDQNNSKSVNLNRSAAAPLTNANIRKSQPDMNKNGTRLPANHEQRLKVSQSRSSSSSLPENRLQKKVACRVPSTTSNASMKTIPTNTQQKTSGKPLPGKSVKNSSALPNSRSSVSSLNPVSRQPPPSELRTKPVSNKVISKQSAPQKSSVPPNPYLQKPLHPNASRQPLPTRGPPPRGPPPSGYRPSPREMPSGYRPPPREMSSGYRRPPYHPSNRPPMKRRIESEDEYDEEMADFIDDGPADTDIDYSTHIKEIFGYDRSRYLNEREDDIVESSFAQQMKEEAFSTRYGMLEDLEDIQREQNELAQSRKKKKRLKK